MKKHSIYVSLDKQPTDIILDKSRTLILSDSKNNQTKKNHLLSQCR